MLGLMLEILLVVGTIVLLFLMTRTGRAFLRMYRCGYLRAFAIVGCLAALVACLWSFCSQLELLNIHDEPFSPSQPTGNAKSYFYGIMFDAGSTGSRIHAFKFERVSADEYELVEELFEIVKPGLSSFASNPVEGAETLRPLLDKAKEYIPRSSWSETPLALKATAGLRLLSDAVADRLLNEVHQLFESYPFWLTADSVSILDGTEEGLFCWFTVNFLHGVVRNSTAMIGVIDLGGGSVQITFHAKSPDSKKHSVDVSIFGTDNSLYSKSYLGLGLMSGRFQVIGANEDANGVVSGVFNSSCLPPNYSGTWKYAGKEHKLFGLSQKSSTAFQDCYAAVQRVITRYDVDKPPEIASTRFYALSYFVDTAVDVDLAGDLARGSPVTVQDLYNSAQKVCAELTTQNPFFCLDTCYLSSLLHDAFGFDMSTSVILRKKIKDIEIAWPLGAMFDVYGQFKRKV